MAAPWTAKDVPDQSGRVAVVTGANSGLGYETALVLAGRGAHVVLACRNQTKADAARDRILAIHPDAAVSVEPLDLAELSSVAAFADRMAAGHDRLDLLVNNAGIMAVDEGRTTDGFELQFGVNHLGGFALTGRLLPMLVATPAARITVMSSFGHRAGRIRFDDLMFDQGYRRWAAYFQSKLANLLFVAELQRRLDAAGHRVVVAGAHPGSSNTGLVPDERAWMEHLIHLAGPLATQPASGGALPLLRAITDPSVPGGAFYGPRWRMRGHPVRETPARRARDPETAARLWARSTELVGSPHLPLAA